MCHYVYRVISCRSCGTKMQERWGSRTETCLRLWLGEKCLGRVKGPRFDETSICKVCLPIEPPIEN